jgi:hypothetical protein
MPFFFQRETADESKDRMDDLRDVYCGPGSDIWLWEGEGPIAGRRRDKRNTFAGSEVV